VDRAVVAGNPAEVEDTDQAVAVGLAEVGTADRGCWLVMADRTLHTVAYWEAGSGHATPYVPARTLESAR